jgi:hypothetical protein
MLQSGPLDLEPGPYSLSLEVLPEAVAMLRIHMLDASNTGVYSDFDFSRDLAITQRMGPTRQLTAGIKPVGRGWYRIWLGATLPGNTLSVSLHLSDANGGWSFLPSKEAVSIRKVQLERGHTPTEYKPTSGPSSPGFIKGDGVNLVRNSEGLKQVGLAESSFDALDGTQPRVYRLTATGKSGEHYASIMGLPTLDGPYTASVRVRRVPGIRFRLQLIDDGATNGCLGEFNPETGSISQFRIGRSSKIDATIDEVNDGWVSISITCAAERSSQLILQLLDRRGQAAFAPAGEALEISSIQVERGQSPSPYRP